MEILFFMPLSSFELFLKTRSIHPLVDPHIPYNSYVPLDLSVKNTELRAIDMSNSKALETFIWRQIKMHNAKVAFGGYLEHRAIYNRSTYFNKADSVEARNIHLGLDLWLNAGSTIYAPLGGEIHSFKNNTNFGDYGPTLILKHKFDEFEFYTLYGHLSLASIDDLKIGQKILQGQNIATLGTAEVNGDYPPHLHFQIIKDIQDYHGDYPGVSNRFNLEFYKMNCPDPNLLLHI